MAGKHGLNTPERATRTNPSPPRRPTHRLTNAHPAPRRQTPTPSRPHGHPNPHTHTLPQATNTD
jgi:hypothetical protein